MDLVSRVKGILLSPKSEWATIDNEPATPASLYSGYVVPLAAVPAICAFIGLSLIGTSILGTAYRTPIGAGLTNAVVSYVMSLVMVFVVALIIDALAPTFGGQKSQIQALKVAAYSATASWVGGIFMLLPALGLITLLFSLYSLYLLYLGLPALMKAPEEKAVGYTVVVVVCVIVLAIVIVAIQRAVVPGAITGYSMPRP
jgi:Yip1-like protein